MKKIVKVDGKKIKELRKKYRLTQEGFGGYINMTCNTIRNIEKGHTNTHINTLNKIVEFFKSPKTETGIKLPKDNNIDINYFLI